MLPVSGGPQQLSLERIQNLRCGPSTPLGCSAWPLQQCGLYACRRHSQRSFRVCLPCGMRAPYFPALTVDFEGRQLPLVDPWLEPLASLLCFAHEALEFLRARVTRVWD